MHYHIILSERCNSQCKYCYEKSLREFDNGLQNRFEFDFSDSSDIDINYDKLKEFLLKDEDPYLIFYGGEPLIKIDEIIKIMDKLEGTKVKFRMQTNGKLLNDLPIEYLKKIDKILISIDGTKEITNYNRGEGTYEKVIFNLREARKGGYKGEIVARMTISQDFPNLFPEVQHLIQLIDEGIFDSLHWQLDVGFYKFDFEKERINQFFKEYNESNSKLIDWWISKLEEGKIYKIYPFIGIINPLLKNIENCGLRCGSGFLGYTITTSGKIVHCPIMNNIRNFEAGNLNNNPNELKRFDCKDECENCEVYGLCGGRCMYWRKAKLWPKEGNDRICNSVKLYINKLKENIPKIKKLIQKGIIEEKDFDYEEAFGPEIIP
jgi:putative peptide-modifying radical SAM enzyme